VSFKTHQLLSSDPPPKGTAIGTYVCHATRNEKLLLTPHMHKMMMDIATVGHTHATPSRRMQSRMKIN